MQRRKLCIGTEEKMAKTTLVQMAISELIDLRDRINQRLDECRTDIEKQLHTIAQGAVGSPVRRGRSSPLKGKKKVAAKFRGPAGETWTGRGARPRWLVAALRGGKRKLDDFLIDKPARKKQRKRKKMGAWNTQQLREAGVRRKKQKRKTVARKKRQTTGRRKQQIRKAVAGTKQQKRTAVHRKKQNRKRTVQSEMLPVASEPATESSEQ
jgi:DNA-binding protein H-NS